MFASNAEMRRTNCFRVMKYRKPMLYTTYARFFGLGFFQRLSYWYDEDCEPVYRKDNCLTYKVDYDLDKPHWGL